MQCLHHAEESIPQGDLCVVDVNDSTAPYLLGFYDIPDDIWDIEVVDSMLYVLAGNRLHIINAANPDSLVEIGNFYFYPSIHLPKRMDVSDGYIYVAAGIEGLYVLKLNE